jgi:hypothetical protein
MTFVAVMAGVVAGCSGTEQPSAADSLKQLGVGDSPETVLAVSVQHPRESLVMGGDLGRKFLRVQYAVRGYAWADAACATDKVITTVGPYSRYGLPLVAACAAAGTDYADLTGEATFVRRSIDDFHKQAIDTGARIVHACGFDSVPSDMSVYALYRRVQQDGEGDEQSPRPGQLDPILEGRAGIGINSDWQARHWRVERVLRRIVAEAGKEQRCRFPGDTRNAQQHASDHAR